MSNKRDFSQFTTQESQSQSQSMPKRTKYAKRSSKAMVPYKRYKELSSSYNRTIISQTVDYDYDLTVDVTAGFSFTGQALYRNGVSVVNYSDASSIAALYDLCRVHKVEMTILPGNSDFDYNNNGLSSGSRNIPYLYTALDYTDSANPSLANVRENSTCQVARLDKVYRRTFYPRQPNNNVTDMGANRKNLFTGTDSISQYMGIKVYIDLAQQVWTYNIGRISFKVFLELRDSK